MRTAVLGNAPDRHRIPASAAVRRVGGGPVVAPGEATAIVAACGALPFALGGSPITKKKSEGVRLVPAHADHRLLGPETVAPVFVVPEARSDDPVRRTPRPACLVPDPAFQVEAIADEGSKLRVGDGGLADLVGGGGGAPARMLVLLSFRRVASHPESARRDGAVPHASHGNTKGARPGKQVKKGDGAARRPAGAAWRRRLRPGWHAGGLPRRPRGQRERDAGQAGPSAARPRRHLRIHRRRGGTPDPPLARPHPRRAVSRSGPALARGVREAPAGQDPPVSRGCRLAAETSGRARSSPTSQGASRARSCAGWRSRGPSAWWSVATKARESRRRKACWPSALPWSSRLRRCYWSATASSIWPPPGRRAFASAP